jgi:hypothetical protein
VGLSGWTYEHIKASTSQDARADVFRLVQAAVRGNLPHLPLHLDARLLSLQKPSGGVCLIAVGEVWYPLAALCALAACPNAGSSLVSHPSLWGYLILGSGGQFSGSRGIARDTWCSAC